MVHGEYNYHNILFDATSEKDNYGHRKLNVYTVNFDHFKKNVQVEDFVLFLKKGNGKNKVSKNGSAMEYSMHIQQLYRWGIK